MANLAKKTNDRRAFVLTANNGRLNDGETNAKLPRRGRRTAKMVYRESTIVDARSFQST
jgi:hypothetical protein